MNLANQILEDEGLPESAAGKVIGVKNHTLRKWRQQGTGPEYYKISARCVRYRRSDLLRWLESRRVVPGSEGERDGRGNLKRIDQRAKAEVAQ